MLEAVGKLLEADIDIGTILAFAILFAMLGWAFWAWRKTPAPAETERIGETIAEVAKALGSVIANELGKVIEDNKTDREQVSRDNKEFATILKEITSLLVKHASASAPIRDQVQGIIDDTQLVKTTVENTDKAINTMNSTMDNQKDALQQILEAIQRIEGQVNGISNKFDELKTDADKLGAKIEVTKTELVSIKQDVTKLKTKTTEEKTE